LPKGIDDALKEVVSVRAKGDPVIGSIPMEVVGRADRRIFGIRDPVVIVKRREYDT
jgi:hypothetical protein